MSDPLVNNLFLRLTEYTFELEKTPMKISFIPESTCIYLKSIIYQKLWVN